LLADLSLVAGNPGPLGSCLQSLGLLFYPHARLSSIYEFDGSFEGGTMRVCSIEYVYHALLNPEFDKVEAILKDGLRPLSDFPDSERWKQMEKHMPGFYEGLYEAIARPVIKKPYNNSGIFVTPIDFQKLPDSMMNNKTRIKIPVAHLDPAYCVLTYVLNEERVSLELTSENLEVAADIWTAEMVRAWFAKDRSKLFYYVPQVAVYQPQGISVKHDDIEEYG
jgi:hypothetical protein